jgi:two-component system, sensor histidine kinase YesM
MAKAEDFTNIVRLTQHLGNYYQSVTRSSTDEVDLQKEVNHARDYVEIQSIRFSNRITAEFDPMSEGCHNVLVPRLILQPILENAYNHGAKF